MEKPIILSIEEHNKIKDRVQAETEGGIVPTPLELINLMRQCNMQQVRERLEKLQQRDRFQYNMVATGLINLFAK